MSPEVSKDWHEETLAVSLDAAEGSLEFGGRTVIAPLLLSLKHILCRLPPNLHSRGIRLLENCWSAVLELRRNELFWPALNAFIATLMQSPLILNSGWASHYALKVRVAFHILSYIFHNLTWYI